MTIPGIEGPQILMSYSFYSTGTYSDLVIKCNGQQWKVHKFQVCAQSEFFHKACSGEFKVRSEWSEM